MRGLRLLPLLLLVLLDPLGLTAQVPGGAKDKGTHLMRPRPYEHNVPPPEPSSWPIAQYQNTIAIEQGGPHALVLNSYRNQ